MKNTILATDLRIGNLVYYNGSHKEIGVVTGVDNCFVKGMTYVNINHRCDIRYDIKDLHPIELTEEILFKCEFMEGKMETDNFIFSIIYYDCWNISFDEKEGYGDSECFLRSFWSLNELQNLFHSLTKQELNVTKLTTLI